MKSTPTGSPERTALIADPTITTGTASVRSAITENAPIRRACGANAHATERPHGEILSRLPPRPQSRERNALPDLQGAAASEKGAMISRHHRPDFSVWDARTDLARCHTCGQPVNAATWVRTECQGSTGIRANTEGCPVVSPMAAVPDPEGEQPIDGSPVTVAPFSEARGAERERTLVMIQRCAEHQW